MKAHVEVTIQSSACLIGRVFPGHTCPELPHDDDWVDQFDTLGLGKNTPIITGNSSDSLIALVNGKWVVMRVPYPLGFFAKGMDGRIDDAKTGWKGKGVWTTWGTRTPFHSETGKGTTAKVVHFQVRPDPLAN